jgi:hypothetical protein
MPKEAAWSDLINGLGILYLGKTGDVSPLHCEHDVLTVMSDPARFTPDQIAHLERLGFNANYQDEVFYSFRFGSA